MAGKQRRQTAARRRPTAIEVPKKVRAGDLTKTLREYVTAGGKLEYAVDALYKMAVGIDLSTGAQQPSGNPLCMKILVDRVDGALENKFTVEHASKEQLLDAARRYFEESNAEDDE